MWFTKLVFCVCLLLTFFYPSSLFAAQEKSEMGTPGKLRILGEVSGNIEVSFEPIPSKTKYAIVDTIKGEMVDIVNTSSSAPFYLDIYTDLIPGREYSLRVVAIEWNSSRYTQVSELSSATKLVTKVAGAYPSDWLSKEVEIYYEVYRNGAQINAQKITLNTTREFVSHFDFISGQELLSLDDSAAHIRVEKGTLGFYNTPGYKNGFTKIIRDIEFNPWDSTTHFESLQKKLTPEAIEKYVFKDVEYLDGQAAVVGGWYLLETMTGERVQFTVKSLKESAVQIPSFEFSYGFSGEKNIFFNQPLHFFITERTYPMEMIDEYQFQVECVYCKKDSDRWTVVKRGSIHPDPIVDPPISYVINYAFPLRERANFQLSKKIEQNIIKNFNKHQFRVKIRTKLSDGSLSPWSKYEYFTYTLSSF